MMDADAFHFAGHAVEGESPVGMKCEESDAERRIPFVQQCARIMDLVAGDRRGCRECRYKIPSEARIAQCGIQIGEEIVKGSLIGQLPVGIAGHLALVSALAFDRKLFRRAILRDRNLTGDVGLE